MAKKSAVEKVQEAAAAAATPDFIPASPSKDFDVSTWARASSEIWRPEEGEFIIGIYQGNKPLPDEYKKEGFEKEAEILIHFLDEIKTGNRVSFVGGMMADKWITESPITIGTTVYIAFTGTTNTSKNHRVNNWDIRYKQ